jgi:hypothetical protein
VFAFAQTSDNYFQYKDYKASADANFNYEFNSSSITNKFLNLYMYGDHIDSLNKQWMFAALHKENSFGADIEGGLTFTVFPDSFAGCTRTGMFFKYNKYYHVDISFTDDLFELFFDGNKRFAGSQAVLGGSSLNVMYYDQIQIGFIKKFSGNRTEHTIGFGIGINNGYLNNYININNGYLFTEANAEYLDLSADYEISRSDTSRNKSSKINGYGASVSLYYSGQNDKNNIFSLELSNLGYIRWNKNSQHFSKDTSIHFEGVAVTDILNIEGNIFDNANTDSVIHEYTSSDTICSYNMMTPATLKITYLYNISDKARIEFGIKKKFFSHYDPYLTLKTQYLPDRRNIISLNFSYGGYSSVNLLENHNMNAGIEYAHDFGRGWIFAAGSNYLNGLIWPYSTTAQGAFVTLKKYFF